MSKSAEALIRTAPLVNSNASEVMHALKLEGRTRDAATIGRLLTHHIQLARKLEAARAKETVTDGT